MALIPTSTTIPRAPGAATSPGPGSAEAIGDPAAAWPDVEQRLRRGEATTWLSLRSEESVHTRPVFAAWTGATFVHASNAGAVKARYLDTGAPCSLALAFDDLHLSVEVRPVRLTTGLDLERAVAAFSDVYGWPTTVAGDQLDAPYAAPSSGGPPFNVYELTPLRAWAFPTADQFEPTRFAFGPGRG